MKLPNNSKVLAATYNPVSDTKMFTIMVNVPYVLLSDLLEFKELNVTYKKIEDIELEEVLCTPFKLKDVKYVFRENDYSTLLQEIECNNKAKTFLTPFAYTTCIISGTEWDNFFELRCPKYKMNINNFNEQDSTEKFIYAKSKKEYEKWLKQYWNKDLIYKDENKEISSINEEFWQSINKSAAQPEFQVIAEMLYDLYQEVGWQESKYHIPFGDEIKVQYKDAVFKELTKCKTTDDTQKLYYQMLMKISASMCAKLSYNTQEDEDTLEKHLERANMLIEHKPRESFSHQAVSMTYNDWHSFTKTRRVKKELYDDSKIDVHRVTFEGDENEYKGLIQICEKGWCNNLKGFIPYNYQNERGL